MKNPSMIQLATRSMVDTADRCLLLGAQSMATRKARWVSVSMVIMLTIVGLFNPRDNMFLEPQPRQTLLNHMPTAADVNKPHDDDGCGLSRDASTITWSTFTADDVTAFEALQACARRLPELKGIGRRDLNVATLRMLQCQLRITMTEIHSAVNDYETIWFIGDSVLEQQFYTFLCMVDPLMTRDQIYGSGLPGADAGGSTGSPVHTIARQWTYNHSNGAGATKVIYSKFGLKWLRSEYNLYVNAFPKAVESLTGKGAIVLDASVHYESREFAEMERAVTFIRDKSMVANASILYMESTPEEWPTSNGLYTKQCMWQCRCEALGADRIMGRGSHSDPKVNLTKTVEILSYGDPPIKVFGKLFPDLAFANNTESCIPDCVPATWRSDLARSILNERPNRVHMVPVWYQFVGKQSQSGRRPGDCTHKSLDAVLMMNQQLVRSMLQSQSKRHLLT